MTCKAWTLAAGLALGAAGHACADIKLGYLDTLSGPTGGVGEATLTTFQLAVDRINAAGGVAGEPFALEVYDGKGKPDEVLVQFQKAIDDGVRHFLLANGSSLVAALVDALNKYNARNPGEEALLINYGASATELTEENCSFWHFRFTPHAGMAVNALTDYVVKQGFGKVYVIGQDYVWGRNVADAAVSQLAEKAPGIEIVGNELHPVNKVKDFTPYVQKIISAGADVVITGNWGQDMTLLVKSAADSGATMPFLTVFGGSIGTVAALGDAAVGQLYYVSEGNSNMEISAEQKALVDAYEARFPDYDYTYHRNVLALKMLKAAIETAGSADAIPVAKALEGMTFDDEFGPVEMRADDHQLLQNLYVNTVAKGLAYTVDKTDLGWTLAEGGAVSKDRAALPTTCEMKRPE